MEANSQYKLTSGAMFNIYPDSIGGHLREAVKLLQRPELKNLFSLLYLLPSFFTSDLDRGFSIIDYDINQGVAEPQNVEDLRRLGIDLKFDLVLNHLSVSSPQFQNLLREGERSPFKDFFIDWNEFWRSEGELTDQGLILPHKQHLDLLFMRKPGLPILFVRFPDGSERPYWNTFYQSIQYHPLNADDVRMNSRLKGLRPHEVEQLLALVAHALSAGKKPAEIDLSEFQELSQDIVDILESKRSYLGQMDLDARSEIVWDFYTETLAKLRSYGAVVVRLDAFAYLHKEVGKTNFFNIPGTWNYLDQLQEIADRYELVLLPELHAEYGKGVHNELAQHGFPIYDFFLPGLIFHAIESGTTGPLLQWIREIDTNGLQTINMLGCHDGIPMLDLKGWKSADREVPGLLPDDVIEEMIQLIVNRGGFVKNLYDADGKKISYYQVNATYFSALGEDERKMRLARALQLFTPGIPQIWYLDLFVGTNDYEALAKAGAGNHKEINRTNLSWEIVEERLQRQVVLDQIEMIRLRNTSPAFLGKLEIQNPTHSEMDLTWRNGAHSASLKVDLQRMWFTITFSDTLGNLRELNYT